MRRISRYGRPRLFGAVFCILLWLAAPAVPCLAGGPWTNWLNIGTNADGRLELFEVQQDGVIRHRWQRESLHDWSSWSTLGGSFEPGIAVVNDASGRLVVFAVQRHANLVVYNFQTTSNSPIWSEWVRLPGPPVSAPVASCQDIDGRLHVFAVARDGGALKHIFEDHALAGWSVWSEMGGPFEPGPVVARDKSGQMEVFAISQQDHVLSHCWQTEASLPNDWSLWCSMRQPVLPGFTVVQNKDERLEVFGVNATNGFVTHSFQWSPLAETTWSEWSSLHVQMRPGITAGRCRDGRVEIFTVSPTNNMIYHSFQMRAGATNWASWTDMSLVGGLPIAKSTQEITNHPRWADVGGTTRSYPIIAKDLEGTLEIFAFDGRLEEVLNHRRQITGVLNWTDWLDLDATQAQYMSRAWRMDDGLPDNRVQAIAQTADGYLWVGTHNGLAQFDGVKFLPYDIKHTFRLTTPSVTCLCATWDGALWVGTEAEGLLRITRERNDHFTASDGLAGDRVTALFEGRDRALWIGTTSGLSRFRSGTFANYTRKQGLVSDNIRSIVQDSESGLWVTTDRGLNCLKGKNITTYTHDNGLPDNSLTGIWQDVPGRLWIGSDHGLILFRGNNFHPYDWRYGLSDRLAGVIRSDTQGNLWVGNNSGLSQFKEGRFFEELDQNGNPFGKVNVLFNDHEGSLWAGTQEGLFLLTQKRLLVYGRPQQLTHDNITSVLEDNEGSLWIGTWGGGLDRLKDETITCYAPSNDFQFDLVSALGLGSNGSLWVGGYYGGGLIQIQRGTIVWRTRQDDLANVSIRVLREDQAGRLWIGTKQGLLCLSGGKLVTNSATRVISHTTVRAIAADADGAMWFGTDNGLGEWKEGRLTRLTTASGLSDDVVTALYEDEDGVLWIGTAGGGLDRLKAGRLTSYKTYMGLFSNEILEIVGDDFGWLWMSCSKGVFRVSKKNLEDFDDRRVGSVTCIVYGRDDGMESVLCSDRKPGGWKTRDGRLWFATGNGLVAIDPRVLKVNRTPPPVYIQDIVANGIPLALPSQPQETRIPPGHRDLEFQYTAPNFDRPERTRFKYQLEGVDQDWVDAGTRRTAYYNNLAPGHYRFRVTACNSDGVWNEAGTSQSIWLVPFFWQTSWFRVLAVTVLVIAVAGTARQVTKRRMQRKMLLMEQRHAVEKERLRIAQDIHDDLGGSLTQIALLGELAIGSLGNPGQAARHLSKITDSARLNVRALDEIVWAVHPGNDTLNSVVLYLWQFAEEYFGGTPVRCRVEAPPDIPSHPLPSDLRHGIFLVVKEAFNNTIKHAHATEVRLRFQMTDAAFTITIEDNGSGFSMAEVNGSGNGLANMRHRVQEFGGRIAWTSNPGGGTRVEFTLPLKNNHVIH